MTLEIVLANGKGIAVIDEEDSYLLKFKWQLNGGYAQRCIYKDKKKSTIFMHREILGNPVGQQVDHINGNKLDNRRKNLRLVTNSQNQQNQRKLRGVSKFKGVCLDEGHKKDHPWKSYIKINGKSKSLGYYNSEEEAARAYDKAAKQNFGEFACTNESLGLYEI